MTQAVSWRLLLGTAALAVLVGLPAVSASALDTQAFDLPAGTYVQSIAQGPNGKLWFTAQRPGALGELDPKTGAVRLIPIGDKATPIIVAVGKDGNPYMTDMGQNAIVRVDAKTNEVKRFPVPQDRGAIAVNSLVFDRDGILWFTGRGPTDAYGRLNVDTGEMKIWRSTEGRASQGITVTPNNEVWYVSVVGSYIARIDRNTGEQHIVRTTQPAVEPHGLASDSKGNLWVDIHNSGVLARYALKTGKWTNWRVPGSKPTHAFGVYVDDKDIVWVVQSSENTVYAFDPKSEKFIAAIEGSKPGANVRRVGGRRGEVWLPEGGSPRIVIVKTAGMKADKNAVNTNIDTQNVVLKAGDWSVRRTPDGMTGKVSCTGYHRNDYQVLLTEDQVFVNQAKNGGFKEYTVRFDEEPASAMRTASAREDLITGITFIDQDFAKALGAKRVRLSMSTAAGRKTEEDIDLTGIKAAHDAIVSGKDCR